MRGTVKVSRDWRDISGLILLAIVILITARVALARDSKQSIGPLDDRVYKNIFEYRMCLAQDSNWCPNGDDFKSTLFDEMYENPALGADPAYFWDDEGVMTPHYPTSTVGTLTRYSADFCEDGTPDLEDGTCPDVYDLDVVRCLDGTRPVFYYEPGSGADANKWLFKIQNGGLECSDDCPTVSILPLNRKDFSSAYNENGTTGVGTAIFSNNSDNLFKDYNVVMLDKCFGDRNLGDATYTDVFTGSLDIDVGTGPVYFHGYRVILAVLRRLEREFNLADAEQIVFTTHSNGTNGAYHYIDRLSDHISTTLGISASVRLVASSYILPGPEVEFFFEEGYWPENYTDIPGSITSDPGIINAPNTPPTGACGPGFDRADPYYSHWILEGRNANGGKICYSIDPDTANGGADGKAYATEDFQSGREAFNFTVWGVDNGVTVTWDQSCVDAHASDPDLRACRDPRHVFTHHLQTPTFFSAQLADRGLRLVAHALSTWSPEGNVWWPEDMKLRVEKLAEVISGYETRSDCADDDLGAHGFFIDNTVEHMSVNVPSKMARQMKANTGTESGTNFQFQEYLMYWLQPSTPTVQCLDSNPIYDAEFMPPYIEPPTPLISYPILEWPANVRCQTGYYPGGSQPYQSCDDPGFGDPTDPTLNKADPRWICQGPPILKYIYLPLVVKSLP